jgi:hypothetical protein
VPEASQFYRLRPVDAPWGDHGHILYHGMSSHQPRKGGCLRLERTGPPIFPITFPGPGEIVVTGRFRQALEGSGLTVFAFRTVIKHHIVELDWEDWDPTAEEPERLPESGEPEDYILGLPHSDAASTELGDLWELVPHENGADVIRIGKYLETKLALIKESWNGTDFFFVRSTRMACVSERARR